ncbi:MAG: methyltransferase domain-containing protein [Alphaproteobacteria bacterium]|nr:methyltransferase domain-containing protein [Alphaproteobacteria bacterium]
MYRTLSAIGLALALSACATPPPARTAVDYAPLLSAPTRPADDRTDDAARKPDQVLSFIGLNGGETVLELEAGAGYYTELLAGAVGPSGKVYMQNPPEFDTPKIASRLENGRLPNVQKVMSHFDDLSAIPSGSVDKVTWILGPHELYYTPKGSSGLGDPAKSYADIARVLKPGGQFIAIDHAAAAGAPTTTGGTIHRIDPAVVMASAKAAGLTFVEKSDILANPADDHTKMVFDPSIRRHTDRFILRFRKPA